VTTSVTTSAAGQAVCPVCGLGFTRVRRQAYCSPGCRQSAWRTRQTHQATTTASAVTVPARRFRRDVTVYTCTECEQRYLGQQWCPDCQRPCTRDGLGGHCPHCEEPVTIDELLNPHDDRSLPSKIR